VHERLSVLAGSTTYAQSANVFDLLGERYQAALSQLALGRLAARPGSVRRRSATSISRRRCSRSSGAARPDEVHAARRFCARLLYCPRQRFRRDADDATSAARGGGDPPGLLARETATALLESTRSRRRRRLRHAGSAKRACSARAGCDPVGRALARAARAAAGVRAAWSWSSRSAATVTAPRLRVVTSRPSDDVRHRVRMFATSPVRVSAVRHARAAAARADAAGERSLEPLLPGFICASAAMNRVADQIQRFKGTT
jgi:hypothetical protein